MEEKLLKDHPVERLEDDEGIDVIDLFIVLAKRKGLIAGLTLGAAVVTAVISLLMTPVYRAETTILPPQTNSSQAAQVLGQLGAAPGLLGIAPPSKSTGDLYMELVKSRTVLDHMVDRFGLMDLYKAETREGAIKLLTNRVTTGNNIKSGILTVSVEDTDPVRASSMANALVEELKLFNKGLSVTEAAQRRLFFEEQLKDAKDTLLQSEEAMKAFQEKSGIVKIDAQANAMIQGTSSLRAQIAAKEVEFRVLRTYSTEHNPDVLRIKEELKGMHDQLSRLESKGDGGDVIVHTGDIPKASTEYLSRVRDLKFSETLYELLLGQYQTAKLDEAREASVIQVLEKAVPPENRIKPKRRSMVILASFMALFASILAAFFLEYKENISKDPEHREKVAILRKYLAL